MDNLSVKKIALSTLMVGLASANTLSWGGSIPLSTSTQFPTTTSFGGSTGGLTGFNGGPRGGFTR